MSRSRTCALAFAAVLLLSFVHESSANCRWTQYIPGTIASWTTTTNYQTHFFNYLPGVVATDTNAGGATNPAYVNLNCGGGLGNPPIAAGCHFCAAATTDILRGTLADDKTVTTGCVAGAEYKTVFSYACPLDQYQLDVTIPRTKVRGEAYPNKYSYYYIIPPNEYMNVRIVARTVAEDGTLFDTAGLGDNIDLYVKRSASWAFRFAVRDHKATGYSAFITDTDLPTYANSNWDFKSVRESNPWAIDIPRTDLNCKTEAINDGHFQLTAAAGTTRAGTVCKPYVVAIMGDNQFPQKSGPSQYELYWYYDFEFPDFRCKNPPIDTWALNTHTAAQGCPMLEYSPLVGSTFVNSANTYYSRMMLFPTKCGMQGCASNAGFSGADPTSATFYNVVNFIPTTASANVMRLVTAGADGASGDGPWGAGNRLSPSQKRNRMGSMFFNENLYLLEGYEINFSFRISNQQPCGGDDGFCGGGDGFALVTHQPYDIGDPITVATENSANSFVDYLTLTNYPGQFGSSMGYGNVSRSLAIEFDTWHNPDLYDPKQGIEHWWINATEFVSYADNHVAFFSHGQFANSADHSSDALIAATPSIPNLSDQQVHNVKVWYFPRAGIYPGSLSLFIDNMDRPALVADVTMTAPIPDPRGGSCYGQSSSWVNTVQVWLNTGLSAGQTATVTFSLSGTTARVWPRTMVFSSTDANLPKTLFITGIPDDAALASDPTSTLTVQYVDSINPLTTKSSTYSNYVTITDVDKPRLIITESGLITAAQSPATNGNAANSIQDPSTRTQAKRTVVSVTGANSWGDSVTVALSQKPWYAVGTNSGFLERVIVDVAVANNKLKFNGQSSLTLYFTADDFNIPQNFSVTADASATAGTAHTITFTVSYKWYGVADTTFQTEITGAALTAAAVPAAVYTGATAGSVAVDVLAINTVFVIESQGVTSVKFGGGAASDYILLYSPSGAHASIPATPWSGNSAELTLSWADAAGSPLPSTNIAPAILNDLFGSGPTGSNKYRAVQITAASVPTNTAELISWSGGGLTYYPDNTVMYKLSIASPPEPVTLLRQFDSPGGSINVLESSTERCVLDVNGKAYVGFTGATGTATQDMDIHSWSFCHKPGCVAY